MPRLAQLWAPLRSVLLLAALGAMASCSDGAEEPRGPRPELPRFVTDDAGRALILHGVNVDNSAKANPDRVPVDFDASDVQHIAEDWDFNFVRFLIFWDAIEPSPGTIDMVYLDRVETYLDLFEAAGVHVMLDMHQDVYSADFCCDGAPSWAIRDDDLGFVLQASWFLNYYQPAVIRAFDNFFDYEGEHSDLQDHYGDAWVAVATRLGSHPAVLGYDLMNEPYPGSLFDLGETALGRPGNGDSETFDTEFLGPFYQRLIERIREVDQDTWLFFEPRYGGPGNGKPSFIPYLSDPRSGDPHLVYSPHLYSVALEGSGEYAADDETIADWERERRVDIEELRAPLLLGEWGIGSGTVNEDAFYDDLLSMVDRMGGGWAQWSYDRGGFGLMDSMGVDRPVVDLVVRPYPRAVAGKPVSFAYDPVTRVFDLVIEDVPGVTGATEISLPAARHYPGGWVLTTSDAEGTYSSVWDDVREVLSYTADPASATHTLRIAPAPAP